MRSAAELIFTVLALISSAEAGTQHVAASSATVSAASIKAAVLFIFRYLLFPDYLSLSRLAYISARDSFHV